jgi:pimeloyl-ACP methyl ester carboxylesterase/DNA-binding CsgD family transcriptional regulator
MGAPPVQYVRTSDGYDIAYAATGEGRTFLVGLTTLSHVQLGWEYPVLRDWLRCLGERFRLVQFDPRGTGMSTRGLPDDVSIQDYVRDVEAVVDRLDLDQFLYYGVAPGNNIAVRYAIAHPERVAALVLSAAVSSTESARAPALYEQVAAQDWDVFLNSLVPRDRNPQDARKTVEILRQAWNQRDLVIQMRVTASAPLEEVITGLRVPTLVLHPRDYLLISPEEGMKVARLAGAQFALIEGSSAFGAPEQGIALIETFLAGLAPGVAMPSAGLTTPPLEGLSARELEVLRLLAAGKSNQQIADALVISLNTVRRHVSNIFDKTGAANRAQATAYAKDHGLA